MLMLTPYGELCLLAYMSGLPIPVKSQMCQTLMGMRNVIRQRVKMRAWMDGILKETAR